MYFVGASFGYFFSYFAFSCHTHRECSSSSSHVEPFHWVLYVVSCPVCLYVCPCARFIMLGSICVSVFSHVLTICCPPIGSISSLMIYIRGRDQSELLCAVFFILLVHCRMSRSYRWTSPNLIILNRFFFRFSCVYHYQICYKFDWLENSFPTSESNHP